MIAVAGPRLDPSTLPAVEGVEVRTFVPDLNRHLAACDIGLVQGGLTTTMESTAYQRPFLSAGCPMDFDAATPDAIAEAMMAALRGPRPRPVEAGVAARVAGMIAELL